MAPVKDRQHRDRRDELRADGRQRRSPDAHRRNRSPAEDEQRVENHVDDHADDHHAAGHLGVAGGDQQVVAGHRQRGGRTAEIPDVHIALDLFEGFAGRTEFFEDPAGRAHAEQRKHEGDREDQQYAGGDQLGRLGFAPAAERLGRSGHHAGGEAVEQAADQHDDREGEAHRGKRRLAQLPDEIGVGDVVAGHRQSSGQHREAGFEHGSLDGTASIDGIVFFQHDLCPFGLRSVERKVPTVSIAASSAGVAA